MTGRYRILAILKLLHQGGPSGYRCLTQVPISESGYHPAYARYPCPLMIATLLGIPRRLLSSPVGAYLTYFRHHYLQEAVHLFALFRGSTYLRL
jgi:hypothetical protein